MTYFWFLSPLSPQKSPHFNVSNTLPQSNEYSLPPTLSQKIFETVQIISESISTQLISKIAASLQIICYALLSYNRIGISFNGGKDSVVMMNLVDCAVSILSAWEHEESGAEGNSSNGEHHKRQITVFHLSESNSFTELEAFIRNFRDEYILRRDQHGTGDSPPLPQYSFESFCYDDMMRGEKGTNWDCIILGVRMSDYDDRKEEQEKLSVMCPTTGNWPKMMRVHPILDWNYGDIWEFTRVVDLPYCVLYEYGYTSIGRTTNTRPNPELKMCTKECNGETQNGNATYQPAWMLHDESKERSGRGTIAQNGPSKAPQSTENHCESTVR